MAGVMQTNITNSLAKAAEHLMAVQKAAAEAGKQVQQEKQQQGGSK
jgi:hypothetical protein